MLRGVQIKNSCGTSNTLFALGFFLISMNTERNMEVKTNEVYSFN